MANTKVTGDLIASSTIATGNIADNAVTSDKISGITTAHITEGTNLYYTDARADARAALLVDSAPSTLNTLNELAAALGDDPNFATTVTNSIATKLPLAGGTLTGSLTITGGTAYGLSITTSGTQDTININRAANNDNAITKYQTASADKWIVGLRNTGDDNFRFYSYGISTDALVIEQANGNSTFAGTVLIDGVSNYTGLEVKGSGASRPQIKFSNVNQGVLGQIFGTEANALVTTTIAGLEYQVRNANGSSGNHVFKSYNTAILTLDGGTNIATFAGPIYLLNTSARISAGGSGEVGFNYNTGATGSLVWYGGGTASKFNVTNAGNATFAGEISSSDDINVNNGKLVVNHASAEVRIKSTSNTGESYISFSDPSDINPGQIYYGHSNNTMSFRTNDISQMSISNNLIVFPSTGVHEIRGDRGSGAFAIGNMGNSSSQMMVSSRGFLTFNVSNTGSALSATERVRIENTGVMKFANTAASTGDVGTIAHYTNNYMYMRGGTGGLAIGDDGFGVSIYLNNSNNIAFHTGAGTEVMQINNVGNVGIGVVPETNMVSYIKQLRIGEQSGFQGHADGVGQDSATWVTTNFKFSTSGAQFINGTAAAPGYAMQYQQQSGDHSFSCSTVAGVAGAAIVERPQMVIKQSGNVGIATTSPIAQLDVAGNTNQRHSVSTTHNGGWRSIQNLGVTGWLDQTYSAGRLKVFGYENGSVNVSYCEYYVIRHNGGFALNQIGTRLSVGNTHGHVDVQISGNFLQIRNVAQSSLGAVRVVFSGMKN